MAAVPRHTPAAASARTWRAGMVVVARNSYHRARGAATAHQVRQISAAMRPAAHERRARSPAGACPRIATPTTHRARIPMSRAPRERRMPAPTLRGRALCHRQARVSTTAPARRAPQDRAARIERTAAASPGPAGAAAAGPASPGSDPSAADRVSGAAGRVGGGGPTSRSAGPPGADSASAPASPGVRPSGEGVPGVMPPVSRLLPSGPTPIDYSPSAAATTSAASFWTRSRCCSPLKDSA